MMFPVHTTIKACQCAEINNLMYVSLKPVSKLSFLVVTEVNFDHFDNVHIFAKQKNLHKTHLHCAALCLIIP